MNKFAPVIIPTLNRYEHFKNCIESLSACLNADKTDLFIALDYPLKDIHWEGYEKIKAYIPSIKGFSSVNVIEREKNYGAVDNFFKSLVYVFDKYDRLIFTEDDNIFAISFLNFINKGLIIYKDREDIFSISGHNSPFPMPKWYMNDVYLMTGFRAWGVGLWRNKWNKINYSLDSFNAMLSNKENLKILKKYYRSYLPGLFKIRDTGVIIGDSFLFLYLLHKKMFTILPVKTRVRNTGHDGSGVNCSNDGTEYMNQTLYNGMGEQDFPFDLQIDKKLTKYVLKQIQLTFIQKLKSGIPLSIRIFLKRYLTNKLNQNTK